MSDRHDYLALDWVRGEIQETLNQAQQALEAFVDNPGDSTRMRFCQTHLHQVCGTLQMVEFYGAALLAEEMEKLARALVGKQVAHTGDGQETLMRAILQLPPYLDRVARNRRDLPVVLLPLLNDLRAACGEPLLSETALFKPDLRHANGEGRVPDAVRQDPRFPQLARKIRQMYQIALLGMVRDQDLAKNLDYMHKVFGKLRQITGEAARAPLWQVADAVVEGIRVHAIEPGSSVKQILGQIDRSLRELNSDGVASLERPAPVDLIKNLLYYVARTDHDSPRLRAIRERFRLDEALPSEDLINDERQQMSGPDAVAMHSVVSALSEEITRVKDALERFVHNGDADPAALAPETVRLKQVADTVAMLGLGQPRTLINDQLKVIEDIVGGQRPAVRDTLMDVAGALLYVEATLAGIGGDNRRPASPAGSDLPGHVGQAMDAVLRECRAGLEEAKDGIVEFIASHWDRQHLEVVPERLGAVRGGLEVVQLDKPAALLRQCIRFIETELLAHGRQPDWRELDTLADAITSVEYYLERLSDDPETRDDVLDLARDSVASLGYPLSDSTDEDTSPNDAPGNDLDTPSLDPVVDQDDGDGDGDGDGDLIDDEIIEIFVEEAGEVLEALNQHFPRWAANTRDETALVEFRRAFHTLKGSGRMVGATTIGELAWAVENMMNRVIDRTIEPGESLIELVRQVHGLLPDLVEAFAQRRPAPHDVSSLEEAAHALARGDDPGPLPDTREAVPGATDNADDESNTEPGPTPEAPASSDPLADLDNLGFDIEPDQPDATTYIAPEPEPEPEPEPQAEPEAESEDDDSVLLEIFRSEADRNLQRVSNWLDSLDTDLSEHPVDDAVHRALHTLKGSARMAEVERVAILAEPAEKLVKELISGSHAANTDTVKLIRTAHDRLRDLLDGPGSDQNTDDLIRSLNAAREELNRGTEGADPNILTLFLAEGMDRIIDADQLLEDWAAHPDQTEELAPLREELKRLGEQAGSAGLEEIEALAGALADCYSAIGEGRTGIGPNLLALAHEGHEALMNMMDCLAAGQTVRAEMGLVDGLRELGEIATPDPELIALFLEEAHDILESAGHSLEAWMAAPDDTLEIQSLQRDLHTLKGGARMADVTAIGDLGHELETLYERVGLQTLPVTPALFELLQRGHDRLAEMVETLETRQAPTRPEALIGDLHRYLADPLALAPEPAAAPADRVPEPSPEAIAEPDDTASHEIADGPVPPEDLDPDILDVFLEEAGELSETLDNGLTAWRDQPENPHFSDDLKRALHTLKGGARLAGLGDLGDIAHDFESRIQQLDQGRSAPEEPDFAAMLASLDDIHHRLAGLRDTVSQQPEVPVAVSAPSTGSDVVREEHRPQVQPQEMVRVGANVLEALVNLAGETSINRSRVEQSISEFGFNVTEMGTTVTRLYEQLRRLDVETEAQILSNYQKGVDRGEFDDRFDPLEMDQYSELHQITKQLSESASDLLDLKNTLLDRTRDTETLLLQQQRINTELQEKLMHTRMVPFSRLVPRLRRIVRQVSGEVGKRVGFDVINPEGELDRTLMERMVAPLEHMLRNAVDHGIESPQQRRDGGKDETGHIQLALSREGGEVILMLSDDGSGIDTEAVRHKAMERGLMSGDTDLPDQEVQQFIFHAGFSTANQVTQLSGRGVGMDVVASEIKQLGGSVMIDSQPGRGTRFIVRLPFTLAMNRALMVKVGDDHYAIPLNQIEGIVRVSAYELAEHFDHHADGGYRYAGQDYDLRYLGRFVHDLATPNLESQNQPLPVLLIRSADHSVALVVDSLTGSREVVVKSVGPQLASVIGISGATILGDGSVVIILDIHSLIRAAHVQLPAPDEPGDVPPPTLPVEAEAGTDTPLVMVVDDSVTVRKVTGRLLERNGYQVVTAKDGIDAIATLEDHKPDAILLDIEMPRMDGFEVATQIRHDARLEQVPIVMITSRTGDKHRERAFDIGVDCYMGKPFQENELLTTLHELLGESRKALS